MKIRLFQIDPDSYRESRAFLAYLVDHELDPSIYELGFDGEVDCEHLEEVRQVLNASYPEGYRGCAMSVSDVVEVERNGEKTYFYCDVAGYREVTFEPAQERDKPAFPARTNGNYLIIGSIPIDTDGQEEIVLAVQPQTGDYVTWECKDGNNYFFGHYYNNLTDARMDFFDRGVEESTRRDPELPACLGLIEDYYLEEMGDMPNTNDLANIPVVLSAFEDGDKDYEVAVTVDLKHHVVTYDIEQGGLIHKDQYDSLQDMRDRFFEAPGFTFNGLLEQAEDFWHEQEKYRRVPAWDALPDTCFVYLPTTQEIGIVKKGESGYYRSDLSTVYWEEGQDFVEELNQQRGVTKAQASAMQAGSMFGWDAPAADPSMYLEDGTINRDKWKPNVMDEVPVKGIAGYVEAHRENEQQMERSEENELEI